MKNGCIADNLPEPEFDILPNIFSICFHIRNYNKTEVIYKSENTWGGFVANGGANGGANGIKRRIVDLMTKNPHITAEQIAGSMKTTKRRIEYYIHQLKKTGLVERIGADKNGHWVVKAIRYK